MRSASPISDMTSGEGILSNVLLETFKHFKKTEYTPQEFYNKLNENLTSNLAKAEATSIEITSLKNTRFYAWIPNEQLALTWSKLFTDPRISWKEAAIRKFSIETLDDGKTGRQRLTDYLCSLPETEQNLAMIAACLADPEKPFPSGKRQITFDNLPKIFAATHASGSPDKVSTGRKSLEEKLKQHGKLKFRRRSSFLKTYSLKPSKTKNSEPGPGVEVITEEEATAAPPPTPTMTKKPGSEKEPLLKGTRPEPTPSCWSCIFCCCSHQEPVHDGYTPAPTGD